MVGMKLGQYNHSASLHVTLYYCLENVRILLRQQLLVYFKRVTSKPCVKLNRDLFKQTPQDQRSVYVNRRRSYCNIQ